MTKRLLKVFLHFKDDSEVNSHSKLEPTPMFPAPTSRVQNLFVSLPFSAQKQLCEMSVGNLLIIPIYLVQSGWDKSNLHLWCQRIHQELFL